MIKNVTSKYCLILMFLDKYKAACLLDLIVEKFVNKIFLFCTRNNWKK